MLPFFLHIALALTFLPIDMPSTQMLHAFSRVEMVWDGGSLPPPSYREHRIMISGEGGSATVHDYDNLLSSVEFPVTAEQFAHIGDVVRTAKIRVGRNRPSRGCTGGSPLRLTLSAGGQTVLSGGRYRCGGKDYGDLYGDVDAIQVALQELVPESAEQRAAKGE